MCKRGVLTIISGFSGSGKGSLVKELLQKYPSYSLSISATTRQKREGEIDGKDYFFLTKDEFKSMIEKDEFLEWAEYVGNYYGTPKEYVERQLKEGKDIILEIELQGALCVKEKFPDALLLFVTPPTIKELERRLLERGTETLQTIQKRLKRAKEEVAYIKQYDYIIINDNLKEAMEKIHYLIVLKHCEISEKQEFISQLETQLQFY